MSLPDGALARARTVAASRLGLDFSGVQSTRLESALAQALRDAAIPASNAEAYLYRLASLPGTVPELARLAARLTVGETYFFRDPAGFGTLERTVLPERILSCEQHGLHRLRLWSAGCATGEEPYSLAILLDQLRPRLTGWDVRVYATDVNPEALRAARRGIYGEWSLRATPAWIRERYFLRVNRNAFQVVPEVRRLVTFISHNLTEAPKAVLAEEGMDVILCCNVLMYFTPEMRQRTADRLSLSLAEGGWLLTSPVEASPELFASLTAVGFPGAILFRRPHAASAATLSPAWARLSPARVSTPVPRPGEATAQGRSEDLAPGSGSPGKPAAPAPKPLALARALADRGQLQEARSACEQALAVDPLDAEAHVLLATICREAGDLTAASDALRDALYVAPDSPLPHFLLGTLLVRQGQRARADSRFRSAARLLQAGPLDRYLPGTDHLSARRLLAAAQAYLHTGEGANR